MNNKIKFIKFGGDVGGVSLFMLNACENISECFKQHKERKKCLWTSGCYSCNSCQVLGTSYSYMRRGFATNSKLYYIIDSFNDNFDCISYLLYDVIDCQISCYSISIKSKNFQFLNIIQ